MIVITYSTCLETINEILLNDGIWLGNVHIPNVIICTPAFATPTVTVSFVGSTLATLVFSRSKGTLHTDEYQLNISSIICLGGEKFPIARESPYTIRGLEEGTTHTVQFIAINRERMVTQAVATVSFTTEEAGNVCVGMETFHRSYISSFLHVVHFFEFGLYSHSSVDL